jgi:hypothetical protein
LFYSSRLCNECIIEKESDSKEVPEYISLISVVIIVSIVLGNNFDDNDFICGNKLAKGGDLRLLLLLIESENEFLFKSSKTMLKQVDTDS